MRAVVLTRSRSAVIARSASVLSLGRRRRRFASAAGPADADSSEGELLHWRAGIASAGWVHMNAAGASPTSEECHVAVQAHMEFERQLGGYEAALRHPHGAHAAVASLIGCDADGVALTDSAQRAWSLALFP